MKNSILNIAGMFLVIMCYLWLLMGIQMEYSLPVNISVPASMLGGFIIGKLLG